MFEALTASWPWYLAGPSIGMFVPLLLWLSGKTFGVSSSLKHTCASTIPGNAEYFNYDWKDIGLWNLLFVVGIFIGGIVAVVFLDGGGPTGLSSATKADLRALGFSDFSGLVPPELFRWSALGTLPGLATLVLGGFLVGFGARYAGGCTSGHGITGMATFQIPSMVAVAGFFVGGLFTTYALLPLLLG